MKPLKMNFFPSHLCQWRQLKTGVYGLVLFFPLAIGSTEPIITDMNTFYEVAENQQKFEMLQANGTIAKFKGQYIDQCLAQVKSIDEKTHCECAAKEVMKLDDNYFMFESLLAFNFYQAMVEAKAQSDEAKYKNLKQQQESRESLEVKLNKLCDIK